MPATRISTLMAIILTHAIVSPASEPSPLVTLPQPTSTVFTDCLPVVQWVWDGELESPSTPEPCSTPIVVQLTDDDGNGRIDTTDTPDVVFIHTSGLLDPGPFATAITAIDGQTASKLFEITSPELNLNALAAADIDSDGIVELIATRRDTEQLTVFEHDGTIKYTGDRPTFGFGSSVVGVADFDQDGDPEIYSGNVILRGSDGGLHCEGAAGFGGPTSSTAISTAVDLDPVNPGLELLAGNTLYDGDCNVIWENLAAVDGFTAVADVDGDSQPEVFVSGFAGGHTLLHHTGAILDSVTGFFFASAPAAGDLDGDGDDEIILALNVTPGLVAFNWDGVKLVELWRAPTHDPSGFVAPALFDFDDDGRVEVLYRDSESAYILRGTDGSELFSAPFASGTGVEHPVIADIDNDCKTEILFSGCDFGLGGENKLVAYECNESVPARPLWNQYQYHVTNIEDDGSIPVSEEAPWGQTASWLGQAASPACAASPGSRVSKTTSRAARTRERDLK